MKRFIICNLILLSVVYSCNNTEENKIDNTSEFQDIKKLNEVIDFVVIEIDSTNSFMFEGLKPAKLSKYEIKSIHEIIENCVNDYNEEMKYSEEDSDYLKLSNYTRQYIAYYNHDGEKEIWANFYSGNLDGIDRKQILIVDDGGNSYFQLNINLHKNKCEDLSVNGVA